MDSSATLAIVDSTLYVSVVDDIKDDVVSVVIDAVEERELEAVLSPGILSCVTDSVSSLGVRKVSGPAVEESAVRSALGLENDTELPSVVEEVVTMLIWSNKGLELDASVGDSDARGIDFSGLMSFKDVETTGSEAVLPVSSGAAAEGAPVRMLSRKLSMMNSLVFISSSTSISNFVLLKDFVIVFPFTASDLFLSDDELVRSLSMVILKFNMLSRKPSMTVSFNFKSSIFLELGLFTSEVLNSFREDETLEPSSLKLTRLTFPSALNGGKIKLE